MRCGYTDCVTTLLSWDAAAAELERTYPGATRGTAGELRLCLRGVPVLVWRGTSSRRDGGTVVHIATPFLVGAGAGADDAARSAGVRSGASGESNTADRSGGDTWDVREPAAKLLKHFGIDPNGPDLVELARAAEQLPLGGLRVLGDIPHLHHAAPLPVEADWLAEATLLIAAECAALTAERSTHA